MTVAAGHRRPNRHRGTNRNTQRGAPWRALVWRPPPTSLLLEEAERLVERRRWKDATRVLSVAATTVEGEEARRPILERLAVTAADGGRHDLSRDAVYELQQMEDRSPATWVAFANVALARGNHLHADRAARAALASLGRAGPRSHPWPAADEHRAWAALAAGYAGLGWFDEADRCLASLDRRALTEGEQWRIGRAVNRWALAGTGWLLLGVGAVALVGWPAVAVATTAPLAVRQHRLRALRRSRSGPELASMAGHAWRSARRLRLGHRVAVWGSVGAFLVTTVAT